MDVLQLIGRIVFVLVFLGSGFAGHFGDTNNMVGYAESRGLKNARPLVLLSGAWIIVAALSVALGVFTDIGLLMVAAFALSAAFLIHRFWTDEDQMTQQIEMTNFMKNLSIAGAAITLFVFYGVFGEVIGFQITDPAFDLNL